MPQIVGVGRTGTLAVLDVVAGEPVAPFRTGFGCVDSPHGQGADLADPRGIACQRLGLRVGVFGPRRELRHLLIGQIRRLFTRREIRPNVLRGHVDKLIRRGRPFVRHLRHPRGSFVSIISTSCPASSHGSSVNPTKTSSREASSISIDMRHSGASVT